ncbi:MAG: glycosyltransferase family 4 protein, partial [Polyangiaceae bacterium]
GMELDVAGAGEARRALEASTVALGLRDRVRFHGGLDDVRPLLEEADAAVCSSRSEGLGLGLLEAMATGLPVMGFAVGGVPEIVVDGETGLLCAPGDVDALAARMREASADRARVRAMGSAARRRVVERFSLASMCRSYAEVYGELSGR